MEKTPVPKLGCFEATPPSTDWVEVPCSNVRHSHSDMGTRNPFSHGTSAANATPNLSSEAYSGAATSDIPVVGNGADEQASVSSGTISWAKGSFPRAIGLTSENQSGTANDFSLQLNTNGNLTETTLCRATGATSGCTGWVQFVYWGGNAEIWYNLLGTGSSCPSSSWQNFSGACYLEAPNVSAVPAQNITNLVNMTLTGIAGGATDTAIVTTGDGKLYAAANTSIFNLSTAGWNQAEFNVFGNAVSYGQASFNAGTTLDVQLLTNNSTTTALDHCAAGGTTGETNNLSLVPGSCCPAGGSTPGIRFMESNVAGATAPACPSTTGALCASNPSKTAVFRYSPSARTWTQIGGAVGTLYSGGYGLFATDPSTGNLLRYNNSPNSWTVIGGPGAEFAVTNEAVYGLTPARDGVFRYTGSGWTGVGGPAEHLYGGGYGLFATNPTTGSIFGYDPISNSWALVGGPGSQFGVTDEGLYGLTPNQAAVYRYNGLGTAWTQVGGAASSLWAGGYGLFAVNPANSAIFEYSGTPMQWTQAGLGGAEWAVTEEGIYGLSSLSSTSGGVFQYSGSGTSWTGVGGPAAQIVACP